MAHKQAYTVPQPLGEREHLRDAIDIFIRKQNLIPPLSINDLTKLSMRFAEEHQTDIGLLGWLMVELNNCVWKDVLVEIPYEKRILLIPKCLSNSAACTAKIDEFGLLCDKCFSCNVPALQDKADELGIMSIVAEGFTSVVGLVESGVVDAVIGVGCLDSLERAFPLLIGNAVPGVAIPLNSSGCKDTDVDVEHVVQMLSMQSGNQIKLLDYNAIKNSVESWFTYINLCESIGDTSNPASRIAVQWLASAGKRWRPYLLTAVYMALTGYDEIPDEIKYAAIAVECFHKASLIHDDIQDNDNVRYGKQTVHAVHGVPIAINVGDNLLGKGYRLLAKCNNMELIQAAAEAHIALCKGQGMELEWSTNPKKLTMDYVLDIFSNKTVPAFEVAIRFGAICAEASKEIRKALYNYSHAMGIAYQLQDDIEDFETDETVALRPSAVLAHICAHSAKDSFIQKLFQTNNIKALLRKNANKALLEKALTDLKEMKTQYHNKALEALGTIRNIELKRLLFRVTKRILK